ncbi:MAG: hypothetical protein NTY19_21080 [Planctomycetota bacterium]|nr:hypothetical protein [Planctomycetota bacterium]
MKSITLTFLTALLLAPLTALHAAEPERVGPPTLFMQDALRYMQRVPDEYHRQLYPIPATPVTRESYMAWIEESGLLDLADTPTKGLVGPNELLPVLAKLAQTGDRKWGDACVAMLKDFHRALKQEVAAKGWNSEFIEPPAVLPLYRRLLIEHGLLREPQDTWFRELMLDFTRTLHVWNSPASFWRGPCHRSQQEGVIRGVVAKWYPDIPEAEVWRKYSEQVFADFWEHKDLTENDTGYSMGPTFANMLAGPEARGSDDFITHPEMMKLWERHLAEVTPDGSINPYGPNGGFNSTAGYRLWMFELIAARTGDGRFRFAAHRLMNYLLYQRDALRRDRGSFVRGATQNISLAWLLTDDKVKPVMPSAGSQLLHRKQVLRIGGKQDAAHYLKDLDPAPDKAQPCCYLLVLDNDVPSKLVFRSGWNPGDLYALVDLFVGADPLNPGGIIGLTRWGAPFTQAISAKGGSEQNRLVIEDLSGKIERRYRKLPVGQIGETWGRGGWSKGESASARVTVPVFEDQRHATFALVETSDWEALPVKVTRQFAFIKNRFLVVRDVAAFEASFPARLGPIWNTQNIGPQVGPHYANTFFSQPRGTDNQDNPLNSPTYDLLVWFAPKPDAKLQVIDRTATDPRTAPVPGQLRYVWQADAKAAELQHVTQLYWPHAPYRSRPAANSNMTGAKLEWLGGEHASTAGAEGIEALLDTPSTSVLRCKLDKDRVEWVVCNPSGSKINVAGLTTDACFAYLDLLSGKLRAVSVNQATSVKLDTDEILPAGERRNFEK